MNQCWTKKFQNHKTIGNTHSVEAAGFFQTSLQNVDPEMSTFWLRICH